MKGTLSRRTFIQVIGGVGASFALGSFTTIACSSPVPAGTAKREKGETFAPNAFVNIDSDGICTVTVSKSDMGQGIRTTFAMLVAEELDADWSKVRVAQAGGDSAKYGELGTGGSGSTRGMHQQLRQVGATARAMLVAAAAKQWSVDASACKTEAGKVIGPGGKSAGYGELTAIAKTIPVPTGTPLKDKSQFKIVGKSTNRVDNEDVVTGKALFGLDVRLDGMLYAVCLRPPAFGAAAATLDDSAARAIPGIVDVFKVGSGIAVVASNTWAALKGREALKATWNYPNPSVTSATIRDGLKAQIVEHKAMPAGAKVIEATFELPYLAHATMEPLNAVADVRADSVEVWTGSQSPDGARDRAAGSSGLSSDKVTVHNHILGGGFGRKFSNEWVGEAVEISKRMKKPVKLLWSRECDIQNDQYRPMSHHAIRAAVDAQGKAVGWSHQYLTAGRGGGGGSFGGETYLPYDIPDAAMRQAGARAPVPTGAWRSVEHTHLIVVNECFIDELAHAAGQDPFEFRRKMITNSRLKKVLETAAAKADWGKPLPAGSGRGIACFDGYDSCIAHVVEVTVAGGKVRVDRVTAVVDVGTAVNPRGVEAQVQGAFMDGLSTALMAAINIEKGGVVETNFDGYRWGRMKDAPTRMEVFVMDSGADFGGMGEVGYPSGPPAIANAIFAATGKRVRKFPINVSELV